MDSVKTPVANSFPPLVDDRTEVLVLGSMPGLASLRQQQYYGHPRNHFWPIIAKFCGWPDDLDYAERCTKILRHRIGIWDVLKSCQRSGSLDSEIVATSCVPNPIATVIDRYPIRAILINGGAAARFFKKYQAEHIPAEIIVTQLPSTSPANARMTFQEKYRRWQRALLDTVQI